MKKIALYCLLILYLVFVSIDFLAASRIAPMPPTVILRLIFSLGCLIWIHLDRKDIFETADFDLIRIFLLFMFITDFIFGTFATMEGPIGRIFFTTGIISACFGHFALILRHLRLSVFTRTQSIGAVSLNISRKVQFGYLLIFVLVEALILFIGLMSGSIDSSPFVAFYVLVSLASWVCGFLYLFSENQKRSRFLAFSGVSLLIISDSFTGLGIAILKGWPYLTLLIWALYAPVLLLIGSSILPPRKELRDRFSLAGRTSHRGGTYSWGKQGIPMANLNSLTKRELELLKLLLQGMSNKQIAAALNISEHTVEFHLGNIYRKLGVSSKAEAIALGKSLGDLQAEKLGESVVADGEENVHNDDKAPTMQRRSGLAGPGERKPQPFWRFIRRYLLPILAILVAIIIIAIGAVLFSQRTPGQIYARESEYPDGAAGGQVISRSNASAQMVYGQLGCAADDPFLKMAAYVQYNNIRTPAVDTLYLTLRYSKNSPASAAILIYLDNEPTPRAAINPIDQQNWNRFTWTEPIYLGKVADGLHSIKFSTEGQQFGVADLDKFILTAGSP